MTTLPRKDKLTLISNLATMLGAGIPILESIESLIEENKGAMRKVLTILRESLNEGHPLSHGMEKMSNVFDPVTVNLVKAAEEAGTLETTLRDLTKSIKKDMEFSEQLKSSLTYPIFVLVIFAAVLSFILAFVIPRMGKVFSGFAGQLPPATKFLMGASDFLLSYWLFIIIGVILLLVGATALFQYRRRMFINAFLNIPGLRQLGRQIDFANFTRSMSLLLGSGIPVAEALEFSETVVSKKEIRLLITRMKSDVRDGKSLSTSLHGNKIVPPMMMRMVETGELSGTLETAMQDMAVYFETQVSSTLKTIATLLEPIMLVVMGGMVGGMMLAVIAPIYSLITQLNGG